MKAWIGAVALLGVLTSGLATASGGTDLLEGCNQAESSDPSESATFTAGYCYGIVRASMELSTALRENMNPDFQSCLPNKMTNKQAVLIVIKYLQDNPEQLHYSGAALVIRALHRAFPCK